MSTVKKIGVFDSGIGGLTVLSECLKRMPEVQFYYLGDNFNAPYGSKPRGEIMRLVFSAMHVFERLEVDAAVLACNTATAVCAEALREKFSFPIIGMEPALRPAARCCKNALVLCTPQTAKSSRLKKLIEENQACGFLVAPCPGLAFEIERALTNGERPNFSALVPPASEIGRLDGIVLGCTHYIFLKKELTDFYCVPAFDGNAGTAKRAEFIINKFEKIKIQGIERHFCPRDFCPPIFLGEASNVNKKVYNSARIWGN